VATKSSSVLDKIPASKAVPSNTSHSQLSPKLLGARRRKSYASANLLEEELKPAAKVGTGVMA